MPARSDQELQFISVSDFRPGIYSDWFAGTGQDAAPDGAAQLSGTYACVASRVGTLMAAPKKVLTQTQALIDAAGTNKYPSGDANMHIMAMRNFSPIQPNLAATGLTPSAYPDMPVIIYSWWYDSGGVGTNFKNRSVARAYKQYLSTTSTFDLFTQTLSGTVAVGSKPGYSPGSIDIARSLHSNAALAGTIVMIAAHGLYASATQFKVVEYPSDASPATDGVLATIFESQGVFPYAIFAHQDRIVCLSVGSNLGIAQSAGSRFLGASGVVDQNEWLFYTDNNDALGGTDENNVQFVNESPFGYGSWRSLNAGELLLIKRRGGGVMIRGDFDRPTVVRLPGIESTGLAVNIGCALPDGTYLYGSERGVWAWSGGDTSALLSPQLEGWFWKADSPASPTVGYSVVDQLVDPLFYGGTGQGSPAVMGSWAMCGDRLVFGPNNFVYDSMGKGWFRHTNPADGIIYGWHEQSARNKLWASPYVVNATQTECLAVFDPMLGQTTYRWTSQPLARSRGRNLQVRELDVVLKGSGTVTFTLIGIAGNTKTESFTVASTTRPIAINRPTAMTAHDIVVQIDSVGTDGSTPAPEVLRFALGYREETTARP